MNSKFLDKYDKLGGEENDSENNFITKIAKSLQINFI